MADKKTLIIIDSDKITQKFYRNWLTHHSHVLNKFHLFQPETFESGIDLVVDHAGDIALIVIDARRAGQISVPEAIKAIREIYTGPMIANSSNPEANNELMLAGCNIRSPGKMQVTDLIVNFLNTLETGLGS